jgi:hypothetical protein
MRVGPRPPASRLSAAMSPGGGHLQSGVARALDPAAGSVGFVARDLSGIAFGGSKTVWWDGCWISKNALGGRWNFC